MTRPQLLQGLGDCALHCSAAALQGPPRHTQHPACGERSSVIHEEWNNTAHPALGAQWFSA